VTGYLCSYPKSGRTWMRFALAHYLRERLALDQELDLRELFRLLPNLDGDEDVSGKGVDRYAYADRADVPLIVSSHLPWDPALFGGRRVVLLVRNPADVMVSRFFHVTRQEQIWEGELPRFLRDPDVGLLPLVRYLNGWAPHAGGPDRLVLSYEELRADPAAGFARLLGHLGVAVDPPAVERALEAASIERMRASERQVVVAGYSYDVGDPEALRVRRAVVGGYRDYLAPDDLDYVVQTCARELTPAARALLAGHEANL
jgi:Sulfotransferase domain